jgi:hypothetical protein
MMERNQKIRESVGGFFFWGGGQWRPEKPIHPVTLNKKRFGVAVWAMSYQGKGLVNNTQDNMHDSSFFHSILTMH